VRAPGAVVGGARVSGGGREERDVARALTQLGRLAQAVTDGRVSVRRVIDEDEHGYATAEWRVRVEPRTGPQQQD